MGLNAVICDLVKSSLNHKKSQFHQRYNVNVIVIQYLCNTNPKDKYNGIERQDKKEVTRTWNISKQVGRNERFGVWNDKPNTKR